METKKSPIHKNQRPDTISPDKPEHRPRRSVNAFDLELKQI
jgi:hypothetical protein